MRSAPLLAVLVLLVVAQSGLWAITVVVNDQVLPSTPPAVEVNNRVLLPMRVVFEALGAAVTWETATSTAVGVREGVTVRLTINDVRARIDDRTVILDVPPMLINNSTYVPVRFPAEAYGAAVRWEDATQTVFITLDSTPPPPPPPPPPTQPSTMIGVLSALEAGQLVLAVGDELQSLTPPEGVVIVRNGKQVALTALQVGDRIEVQYDAAGNPTLIRATFETLTGKIVAKSPHQLLLDSRPDPLVVDPGVLVIRAGGGTALTYSDLKNGDQVTVRLSPGANRVYGIILQTTTPPLPPAPEPVITAFTEDGNRPLRAGDVLRVTLQGTPGGTAWFELLGLEDDLPLREGQAGRYSVNYTIPAGLTAVGVPVIGHLQVGDRIATVESADAVTIESAAPEVVIHGPAAGEQIHNRQPDLSVEFTEESGSGMAWNRCAVTLRGPGGPLAVGTTRSGRRLELSFAPLPAGQITVGADGWDRAGNHTHRELRFVVLATPPSPVRLEVTHNGVGRVLLPGDELVVTVVGPAGGVGTFSLGDWRKSLKLTETHALPGTYRGIFIVPDNVQDRELPVGAALVAAGGRLWTGTAAEPVQLGARRDLLPRVTTPVAGAHVGEETRFEGLTEPYAEVVCTLTWRTVGAGDGRLGRIVQLRLYADRTGRFATGPVRLFGPPEVAVEYTLTVVADQGGRRSPEVTVKFFR